MEEERRTPYEKEEKWRLVRKKRREQSNIKTKTEKKTIKIYGNVQQKKGKMRDFIVIKERRGEDEHYDLHGCDSESRNWRREIMILGRKSDDD